MLGLAALGSGAANSLGHRHAWYGKRAKGRILHTWAGCGGLLVEGDED
jgi:hypothetical protein